jgi:acyl carrier protein
MERTTSLFALLRGRAIGSPASANSERRITRARRRLIARRRTSGPERLLRAGPLPLNLRDLFAIRAPDLSRGRWAAPGRSDPHSPARQRGCRNAWPIRDLLMPSTFDTVANIISETCDIPRETIQPESHAINDLGIDSLDFLDIAFAIDKAFGIKMPLEQWTQEVNDGKATTEQYFQLNNLCTRIDELVAAKGA